MRESDPSAAHGARPVAAGDLTVNLSDGAVARRGAAVELSPTEGRLLASLANHLDTAVPAGILAETLWGTDNATTRAYLQLYVRYLQQKLEDNPRRPHRVRGTLTRGYRLVGSATPAFTPIRGRRLRLPGLQPAQSAL